MRADEIRFLRGRLRFGTATTGAPFPSCVLVYRGTAS
jgi:site-specific DNA-methyltransferase (adenine-specific)